MRTVRAKLAAIVVVCVAPAFAAALLRAREARQELVDEVRARLDSADDAFASDTDDDLASAALSLKLATSEPRVLDASS